jgi:hypothetical protein
MASKPPALVIPSKQESIQFVCLSCERSFRNSVLIDFTKIIIIYSYWTAVRLIKYQHYYYAAGGQILSKRSIHYFQRFRFRAPRNSHLSKYEFSSNALNPGELINYKHKAMYVWLSKFIIFVNGRAVAIDHYFQNMSISIIQLQAQGYVCVIIKIYYFC